MLLRTRILTMEEERYKQRMRQGKENSLEMNWIPRYL